METWPTLLTPVAASRCGKRPNCVNKAKLPCQDAPGLTDVQLRGSFVFFYVDARLDAVYSGDIEGSVATGICDIGYELRRRAHVQD